MSQGDDPKWVPEARRHLKDLPPGRPKVRFFKGSNTAGGGRIRTLVVGHICPILQSLENKHLMREIGIRARGEPGQRITIFDDFLGANITVALENKADHHDETIEEAYDDRS